MSFFLFIKQIADMLYQYKFLDYIMVGLVLMLLIYQIALVRPDLKKLYTKTDGIVLLMSFLVTISLFKNVQAYEIYFKIVSAFLMYFLGRIYYDRIKECYGALTSASYFIVYLNFFVRVYRFGFRFTQVTDAGGDLYYYDTDMAFAMILAMAFIAMFAKNSIIKLLTILVICPYMVFFSDAGIQKILMIAVYTIIAVYVMELVFRKKKASGIVLAAMIIGLLVVVVVLYLPVIGFRNTEMVLRLFDGNLLDNSNMYVRYTSWQKILQEWSSQGIVTQCFGISLDAGVYISSLYIKLLYALGYAGVVLSILFIGSITHYVIRIEDRKTFYITVILTVLLLGTGVTVNSMECVQMSWFPLLFAGMVVSSVEAEDL